MCLESWDDKSADAGELRVESKSMFASQEPELRVLKAFRTDYPKKNAAPAEVQPTLPSSFQAPRISGGAGSRGCLRRPPAVSCMRDAA